MTMRRNFIAGLLVVCGVWMDPATATTLRWANDGDINALDPMTRQETLQISFLSNIYETLLRRTPDLSLEPALAERWEQTTPTTWRFHLRPNVKWQDGSAFTADDVIFSLQRILSPTSSLRANMASVKAARKLDDLTVEFETHQPNPILPQEQTQFLIMSKRWSEAHGAAEPPLIGKEEGYALRHAMGTGPYRLVSREPDRKTVVERNPGWWDKAGVDADRVEFNVIQSAPTRVAALLSGEVDLIHAVPPQDMPRISQTAGLHILQHPELRTMYLGFNVGGAVLKNSNVSGANPLRDLRVRRAFALAVDEPAIISRIMKGLGRHSGLMWGPGVNGYSAASDKPIMPDVPEAKRLLVEAGYPDGFTITLDCTNDRYMMDEQICTAITAMLARIGIKVSLQAQTKGRFFTQVLAPNYDTDFWMLGWTPATYDAHNVLYTLLGTRDGKRGEANIGAYSNPRLDALIAAIGTETDQAKRDAMIQEAAAIVRQDLPVVPLHQQVMVWAVKDGIKVAQLADNSFPYRYIKMK
ncbi:MAG: ABC transporter substrate-binding protein [Acetobacteraceae bacterium]